MTHDGTHPESYDPAEALQVAQDHTRRLGKLPHRHDPRTLLLRRYLTPTLTPPASLNLTSKVEAWPMYGNDRLGDCTCAAAGHMIEAWSGNAGIQATITEQQVVDAYNRVNGGHDGGAVELDVLNLWRKTGIGGHRIAAFARLDPGDHHQAKTACWLFGGLYLGLAMPVAAQRMGRHWSLPRAGSATPDFEPGSWGGHAVDVVGYTRAGVTVVTWGELTTMSWGFWARYCDEAWAVISPDWLAAGRSPEGFDMAALQADLNAIGKPA